jgi:hypothetical protein
MDACNLRGIVNLDGRWGDELEANLHRYDRAHPGRFDRERRRALPALERGGPLMGRRAISGVDLPPEALRKIYAENARRLVPSLRV